MNLLPDRANAIFTDALRAVKERHKKVPFPAQTVEKFAFERWVKALRKSPEVQNDPAFESEGQSYCEFLLLDEVLLFQKAMKGAKKRLRYAKSHGTNRT